MASKNILRYAAQFRVRNLIGRLKSTLHSVRMDLAAKINCADARWSRRIAPLFAWFTWIGVAHLTLAQEMPLRVMTFNVWTADASTAKLAEIIQAGNADIIGLQEMNNGHGQALAQALGFHYHSQSSNGIQVLSRFPILQASADNRGVLIEYTPGHSAWLFNAHFIPYPYQPYDLRDNPNLTEAQLIASAETTRGFQFNQYLASIANTVGQADQPTFLVGDFNEPSHLDWTAAAAAASERTFDKEVRWPGSEKVLAAGFQDSFRAVRPDEVNDRGYTWTPGYPPPNLNNNEVHDRIDIVYSRGSQVQTISSQTIGIDVNDGNTDIGVPGYNSDHRAVVSGFIINGLDHSTLTFSRLLHNPGNSSALNEGHYGDRLIPTPNITLEFTASSEAHWDTYDGDQDGFQNNWNGGVAQLQSDGTGVFDLVLQADDNFLTSLEAFSLVDYIDFASGHVVAWEVWNGMADSGSLLDSGQVSIAADQIVDVELQQLGAHQQLTLRLKHLSGDGTDLAIDNVRFRQFTAIPEPTVIPVLCLLAVAAGARRRRKSSQFGRM